MAHPPNSSLPDKINQGQKNEDGKTAAVHLSADIQDILNDLELDTAPRKRVEKLAKKTVTPKVKTKDYGCVGVNLTANSARPSSKEAPKPDHVRRKRHYDSAAVRSYISRQQVERRRRQSEERRSQQEETERRSQRLQELYKKQKEGFNKATTAASAPSVQTRCLLETYTKLLPEQTQLETDVLLAPFSSAHQQVRMVFMKAWSPRLRNVLLHLLCSQSNMKRGLNMSVLSYMQNLFTFSGVILHRLCSLTPSGSVSTACKHSNLVAFSHNLCQVDVCVT